MNDCVSSDHTAMTFKAKIIPTLMLLIAVALCVPLFSAHAATTVSFGVPAGTVTVGTQFPVTVLLSADQPTNAYSAELGVTGPATLQGTSNAGSIITIWQNNPVPNGNTISFEGGSLSAFQGNAGKLLTLNIVATAPGIIKFAFSGAAVYLANGKGTKLTPGQDPAAVTVVAPSPSAPSQPTSTIVAPPAESDSVAPEIQFLSIIPDPLNSSHKLLSFLVSDGGSGVAHAAVRYRTSIFWSEWQTVVNPASLPNTAWEVDFLVTDNAGNTAEQVVYDPRSLFVLVAGVCGAAVLVLVCIFLIGRRRRSPSQDPR